MPKKPLVSSEQFSAEFHVSREVPGLAPNEFEGMASVFNAPVQSWMPTVVEPGAFKKTLQERASKVKILWQHDPAEPIGLPTVLEETASGLRLRARVSDTDTGRKALTLIRDGVIDSLSIGFDPIISETVQHDDGTTWRHLKEVRLYEVSAVTFPADAMATITAVHSQAAEAFQAFELQTLIFPKKFWQLADARQWCRDHDYKSEVDETGESYRFRQRDPGDFARLRIICFAPGRDTPMEDCRIKAVGGPLKESMTAVLENIIEFFGASDPDLVPSETHEGKVLSAKNKTLVKNAIEALQALLAAAEPPVEEEQALTVTERLNRLREAELVFAQSRNRS